MDSEIKTVYLNRISEDISKFFSYHAPKGDQQVRYEELRSKGKELADLICRYCPPSADTTAALRKLREAIMTANASIACGEADTV